MHLAQLKIENFRTFGSCADKKHLELRLAQGLTVLVGENDSGKTAILDALRLVLGTTSQDYLRINEDDFHKAGGNTAPNFSIYCRFENVTDEEAARFLEWLSFEDKRPVLELTLRAYRVSRKNRSGVDISVIEVTNRSGADGQGKALEGDIRSFLWLTYLKPLRDAESEMSAGRGSRLSQLLLHHPKLADLLALTKPPPEVSDFVGWENCSGVTPVNGTKSPRQTDNTYHHRMGEASLPIRFDSIHGVKGETHAATLVVETFAKNQHDLKIVLPVLTGTTHGSQLAGSARRHCKRIFVGMTRPSHLLCLAVSAEHVRDDQLAGMAANGWKVVQVR